MSFLFFLPQTNLLLFASRRIKEQHCYCAPDLAKEYSKYDKDPRKFFRMYTGKRVRRQQYGSTSVGIVAIVSPALCSLM